MQTSALAFPLAIFVVLTACSSSDSDSTPDGTTTPSGGSTSDGNTSSSGATAAGGSANQASTSDTGTASGGAGGTAGAAGANQGCSVDVASPDLDAGLHVTECSHIDYSTNPPSSGQHYDVWAAYQSYDFPVPRGYWVHGLEHGAVVFTYNCPDGCPDEVAEVESIIDSLPIDPRCVPYNLDHQVILTPDPLLDTRWAMSSWGHTLRADCIDEAAFREFYESNVGNGPEDICGGGAVLTEEALAPNCGE